MTTIQIYESSSIFDLPVMTDEEWSKLSPEQQQKITAFEDNLIKQAQKVFDESASVQKYS